MKEIYVNIKIVIDLLHQAKTKRFVTWEWRKIYTC